ncbi:hypothetical protein [Pseudogracilibacillus sp. SO30301A]|uniref:hypothetical protein n=1 Tax=Pseudogracilibacillus sp. SO30301A TaxID=3098291 RepID=UPI00300DE48D
MSDFLYSTKKIEQKMIYKVFKNIYKNEKTNLKYYQGTWGSLAISQNTYNGFEPLETEEFITVVVGGPLLMFRDNSFITIKESNEGTKSIFNRWLNGKINWNEDFSGPFHILIINKKERTCLSVTDIMSFVPVYYFNNEKNSYICSHVDMLAEVSGDKENLDEISLIDFILHGVVTYPYTFYKNIKQLQPASTHKINVNKLRTNSYWIPIEENSYSSINEAADDIRKNLIKYINKITSETTNIAQFISGGEDSRTLSGLLKDINRDAFIYLDSMNREGKLAKRITENYNATFNLRTRTYTHYLDILPECASLVGTGSEYHHAHTYGFHKEIERYDAVFGGLFSDALLKGARIKKHIWTIKLPFLSEIKDRSFSNSNKLKVNLFDEKQIKELTLRRQEHLDFICQFRNDSAEEWFELWPSSMNRNIPNVHANRRLFKSYEPFLSNEIVKISARVNQSWKLNRKLFHKSVKPFLKPSKWIFHSNGWLPYYSWKPNILIHFTTWTFRQFGIRLGIIKGNQGPWTEWRSLITTNDWNDSIQSYLSNTTILSSELKANIENVLKNNSLAVLQYIALTQVLYETSVLSQNNE